MKHETKEKYRERRKHEQGLQDEISGIDKQIEEVSNRAPITKDAAQGKYYPGTIGYPEPGEKKVGWVFPADEFMRPDEIPHEALRHKLFEKKREKEKELRAVQGELTLIESQAFDEGIPLSVLQDEQTDQPPKAKRARGRPKSQIVKGRRDIVIEVTQAKNRQELREKLKDSLTVDRLFRRLDEEGIPLPSKGYKVTRWTDLDVLERIRALETIKRRDWA